MSLKSPKEKWGTEEVFEEIMAKELLTNLMKNINPEETQWIPSTRNMNKITPRHILIKLVKTNDKEKVLNSASKDMICAEETQRCFVSSKQCKQDDTGTTSFKYWKKNTVNLEFCTQQEYVWKTKAKVKTFLEIQ